MRTFPFMEPVDQMARLGIKGDLRSFMREYFRVKRGQIVMTPDEHVIAIPRATVQHTLEDYEAAAATIAGDPIESYLPTEEGAVKLHPEAERYYHALLRTQESDALLLRVRFGGEDGTGLAPADARRRIIESGRCLIDPVVIAAMIRAHDLRGHLFWLDALGGLVSPKADGRFDDTPYFDCRYDRVIADWNWDTRKRSFRLAVSAAAP